MHTSTRTLIFLATALALPFAPFLSGALAQGDPPARAAAPDDLEALDRFLTMSDDELDALQAAVARVRAMSTRQRAALREQIRTYRELPAAEREEVRAGWGWQSDRDRDDWRSMMHAKTAAERGAMQAELQALAPAARTARKLELLRQWRAAQGATSAPP